MTLTEPTYRCHDCKLKYRTDPEKRKKQMEYMACNYIASKSRHQYKPDYDNKGNPKVKYKTCVGNFYFGEAANLINYYPKYDKGILPFAGGLYDQPAKFVEIMSLVHNLIRENEKETERKNQLIQRNKASGTRSSKR